VSPRTGLAVAIVASALAGAATYAVLRGRTANSASPASAQEGGQPAAQREAPAPKLSDKLPVFTLGDLENKQRTLQDWPNKALIVNFWATWCAPCRREIPLLKELQREHADEGFQVIGIAVDFRDKVVPYAKEMQIDYPVLVGEQDALDAAAAFGVDAIGFPFTVFSDRRGRIVAAHLGELTPAQADVILEAIRRVDAGADTLEQARTSIESGLSAL
jgi:thiol-disulfide isomerase/thioredoxin